MTRRLAAALFALSTASCSGNGGPSGAEGTESGTDSDTDTDSGAGTDSGTDGWDLFESEPEIIFHETQPMVVDLSVTIAAGAELEIEHASDPGVRWAQLEPDRWRIRGLRPGADHGIEVRVSHPDGDMDTRTVDFATLAALPGFTAAFAVTGGASAEPVFRLFDLSSFGGPGQASGVAMIDAGGTTRWYLGEEQPNIDPQGIWSGVRMREDGTFYYTRESAFVVADELGQDVTRVTIEDVGVTRFHHDGIELPNGNFLVMSVEFQQIDYPMQGTLSVYGDYLVEFDEAGTVAWTWSAFDHLDPQRTREGFADGFPLEDPETGETAHDWTHGNGLVYLPDDDSILISMRHQDWIVKIDHETGEVVWRLGEEGDFALDAGTWFYHQHSPEPAEDGTLLLYDNAIGNPNQPDSEDHSRAVLYQLDEVNMTATQVWQDDADKFVAPIMGDADRLPGGNILVLDSSINFQMGFDQIHARLRELDPMASPMEVWSIETVTGKFMYRANAWDRLVGEPAN